MPMYTMRASSSLLGRSGGLDLRPNASPRLHRHDKGGSGLHTQVHRLGEWHFLDRKLRPACTHMTKGVHGSWARTTAGYVNDSLFEWGEWGEWGHCPACTDMVIWVQGSKVRCTTG